ncbi:MAG: prepilin-type N-terminal cleavage/methylation domain-containing protein [Deltaproteobacteria bacterium]|nr:prepilin-type N-terminal cleavage/methylation domain-containing protein [Deltaproteobacteria bacterium]
MRSTRLSTRGFNIIELLLAIALIAIALPSIGHILSVAYTQESDNIMATKALGLAQALMDEISKRHFASDGPELSGYDRRNFDDIADYNYFTSDWGPLSPPRDESGNALTDFSDFSQMVNVFNVSNVTSGPTGRANYDSQPAGTTDFRLVKVTISWNTGNRSVDLYKVFALH